MIHYDFPSSFRRLELFFLDEASIVQLSQMHADILLQMWVTFPVRICVSFTSCFILFSGFSVPKPPSPHSDCMMASHHYTNRLHTATSPTVATPSLPLLPALLPPPAAAGLA
jgi:hypothetical protein